MAMISIDVCCAICNIVVCTSTNEWRQCGPLLMTPIQETGQRRTITIAKDQAFLPLEPMPKDLYVEIGHEASCAACGNVLGRAFSDPGELGPKSSSERVFYHQAAICLKKSSSQKDVLPFFIEHSPKTILQTESSPSQHLHDNQAQIPTAIKAVQIPPQPSSQVSAEGGEAQMILSRFAIQEVNIKTLSRNLVSLQDRMLALEKAVMDVCSGLRPSSKDGSRSGQDMFIGCFETMLGAMKNARSAEMTVEDLKLENEQLKQRLTSITTPAVSVVDGESFKIPLDIIPNLPIGPPAAAPSVPVKKRGPCTKRKPPGQRSVTRATSIMTGLASNHDDDHPTQLGSLDALKEITAAMAQAPSTAPPPASNSPVNYDSGSHFDEPSANDLLDAKNTSSNGNHSATSQPKKRRRTGDGTMNAVDRPGATGQEKVEIADSPPMNAYLDWRQQESRATSKPSNLKVPQPHDSIATQLQNAATHFTIAGADETMIDPALRCSTLSANQTPSASDVLASIENPPEQRQTRQSTQQEKKNGYEKYDSVHQERIRQYMARDALRKRKSRAESSEKKKMDWEDEFKKEEKIRARDKMVKELMEREEMLEIDGDL